MRASTTPFAFFSPSHDMLMIRNDLSNRGAIEQTNYFDSFEASHGRIFGSWHLDTLRLLIPDSMRDEFVKDLAGVRNVAVSHGPLAGAMPVRAGTGSGFEVLFDDYSTRPFTVFLQDEAFDSVPTREQIHRKKIAVRIYSRAGQEACFLGYARYVSELPCLLPVGTLPAPEPQTCPISNRTKPHRSRNEILGNRRKGRARGGRRK